MGLQLGIVGLPNAGKSTLFNALTQAGAAVAPYAFTTIEPNVGIAALRDRRLDALAALVGPERVVPATVEFVDIAGLVRGAHKGEGLGNQFLGHIRNVDAIVLVVRGFQDADIPHPYGRIDPLVDLETLDLELILADLATVERRLEKTRTDAKAAPREYREELELLESLQLALQSGRLAVVWGREQDEMDRVRAWSLLTGKPRLFVVNVGEEDLPSGGERAEMVREHAANQGGEVAVICAQTEMDLAGWSADDAVSYLHELGVVVTGLDQVVVAGFRLLDLVTFFTMTGGKEVRSWPIARNTVAPAAAGKIHTDMERGFVRAEVIPVDELLAAGSWVAARETGRIRIEGRSYLIQDGDVVHFRFAV